MIFLYVISAGLVISNKLFNVEFHAAFLSILTIINGISD